MRILFLDDNPARHETMDARFPLDEIIHVYDIHAYREVLEKYDHFDMISLDHDLNEFFEEGHHSFINDSPATGLDACGYLMKYRDKMPAVIDIHSSNGTGARSMMEFLDRKGVAHRWVMFQDWNLTEEIV